MGKIVVKEKVVTGLVERDRSIIIPDRFPVPVSPVPGTMQDLSDRQFGKLVVVGFYSKHQHQKANWLCYCACGKFVLQTTNDLTIDGVTTCARQCPYFKASRPHLKTKEETFIGRVCDRSVIIGFAGENLHGDLLCRLRCVCGDEFIREAKNVTHPCVRCSKYCNPDLTKPDVKEVARRFIKTNSIQNRAGCWVWTGDTLEGQPICDFLLGKPSAVEVSYSAYNDDVPYGVQVLHDCGKWACVNPKHLKLQTPQIFRKKW